MMKQQILQIVLMIAVSYCHNATYCQNVGINMLTPLGKLHVKGSADNSQFILDANTIQSNSSPLIRLRKNNGTDLMWLHSDDSTNVFLGFKAGSVNTIGPQGENNSFIGSKAGYSNTNGRDNTAVGTNALFSNTRSSSNTAIGSNALFTQSFLSEAQWYQSNNVAVGYEALFSNQPTNPTNGADNTAVGTFSLRTNTTGKQNSAAGTYALHFNTIGNFNTANGYGALYSNTTGTDNTAIGTNALFSNVTGVYNTAIGRNALYSNTGLSNTAIGYYTLFTNVKGVDNVGIGFKALYSNTNASQNIAIGPFALYAQSFANADNYWISNNVAIGFGALNNNESTSLANGIRNTAIGNYALTENTTGYNNVGIGYYANTSLGTLSYATAIGDNATVNASNKVRIGNTAVSVIEGQVSYTWPSDGRFKENIKDDIHGLDFIMKLEPVSFNFNRLKFAKHINEVVSPDREQTLVEQSQIRTVGFIAQDVEKIIRETGFTAFDAVHAPTNDTDNYGIGYAEFVVPLVKAVQELSSLHDSNHLIIQNLLSQNELLTQRLEKLEASLESTNK